MGFKGSTVEQVRDAIAQLIGNDGLKNSIDFGRIVITTSQAVKASGVAGRFRLNPSLALASFSEHPDFTQMLEERNARERANLLAIGNVGDGVILKKVSDSALNPLNASAPADRWKMILRDASEPGNWRTQSFDRSGFSGHMTFSTRDEAVADAANGGYIQRDDEALDHLQETPQFQRGVYTSDLIRLVNTGKLTYSAANDQLAIYDAAQAVVASVAERGAQAFIPFNGGPIYLLADRIKPGTEVAVFLHESVHRFGKSVLGSSKFQRIIHNLQAWEKSHKDSVEKLIFDRASQRASSAADGYALALKKDIFSEELFAYAVEEAVNLGIKPSATASEAMASGWLHSVQETLRAALRRSTLINAYSFKAQDLVDLSYALVQMENPTRMNEILSGFTPREAADLKILLARGGTPIWYSGLEKSVRNCPQERMPGSEWLKWIASQPGIKPDEIHWSGVQEWLDIKGLSQVVERNELTTYLSANAVQVKTQISQSGTELANKLTTAINSASWEVSYSDDEKSLVFHFDNDEGDRRESMAFSELPNRIKYLVKAVQEASDPMSTYDDYQIPGGHNYREVQLILPTDDVSKAFRASHWSEANVLAHLRVNDRYTQEGSKILFIEEIQSDWAQKYRAESIEKSDLKPGAPDGPYIGTTSAWVSLCLKRITKMAADEGYDQVAFISGDQAAERFDQSKAFGSISWDQENALLYVYGVSPEGSQKTISGIDSLDKLELHLGKKLAASVVDAPLSLNPYAQGVHSNALTRNLEVPDSKIGGYGMRVFYDSIVPSVTTKILKKIGGDKLQKITINCDEAEKYGVWLTDISAWHNKKFPTLRVAKDFAVIVGGEAKEIKETHIQSGFSITPAMRSQIQMGMPLFSIELTNAVASYEEGQDATEAPSPDLVKAQQQCAEVASKYLGTEHWMKSPNGLPTKLTQSQWILVRTENFKSWFGDWILDPENASMAVDGETREPRVVFHGAREAGFSEFKPWMRKSGNTDGVFFTSELSVARSYSGTDDLVKFSDPDEDGYAESDCGVYAVFLNIRAPLISDFEGANWDGTRAGQWMVVDEDEEDQDQFEPSEPMSDGSGKVYFDDKTDAQTLADSNPGSVVVLAHDLHETTNSVVSEASQYKCDGAVIYDVVDEGKFGYASQLSNVYVVFKAEQIKSATDNPGIFSPHSSDVRCSYPSSTLSGRTTSVPQEHQASFSRLNESVQKQSNHAQRSRYA